MNSIANKTAMTLVAKAKEQNKQRLFSMKMMLCDLKTFQNSVILIPAPEPKFVGHKIRVVADNNPDWYSKFYYENGRVSRKRVVENLKYLIDGGKPTSLLHKMIIKQAEELLDEERAKTSIFDLTR